MGWVIAFLAVLYFLFRGGSTAGSTVSTSGTSFVPDHPTSFSNANVDNPLPPWSAPATTPVTGSTGSATALPSVIASASPAIRVVREIPAATVNYINQSPVGASRLASNPANPSYALLGRIFGGKV